MRTWKYSVAVSHHHPMAVARLETVNVSGRYTSTPTGCLNQRPMPTRTPENKSRKTIGKTDHRLPRTILLLGGMTTGKTKHRLPRTITLLGEMTTGMTTGKKNHRLPKTIILPEKKAFSKVRHDSNRADRTTLEQEQVHAGKNVTHPYHRIQLLSLRQRVSTSPKEILLRKRTRENNPLDHLATNQAQYRLLSKKICLRYEMRRRNLTSHENNRMEPKLLLKVARLLRKLNKLHHADCRRSRALGHVARKAMNPIATRIQVVNLHRSLGLSLIARKASKTITIRTWTKAGLLSIRKTKRSTTHHMEIRNQTPRVTTTRVDLNHMVCSRSRPRTEIWAVAQTILVGPKPNPEVDHREMITNSNINHLTVLTNQLNEADDYLMLTIDRRFSLRSPVQESDKDQLMVASFHVLTKVTIRAHLMKTGSRILHTRVLAHTRKRRNLSTNRAIYTKRRVDPFAPHKPRVTNLRETAKHNMKGETSQLAPNKQDIKALLAISCRPTVVADPLTAHRANETRNCRDISNKQTPMALLETRIRMIIGARLHVARHTSKRRSNLDITSNLNPTALLETRIKMILGAHPHVACRRSNLDITSKLNPMALQETGRRMEVDKTNHYDLPTQKPILQTFQASRVEKRFNAMSPLGFGATHAAIQIATTLVPTNSLLTTKLTSVRTAGSQRGSLPGGVGRKSDLRTFRGKNTWRTAPRILPEEATRGKQTPQGRERGEIEIG